MRGFMTALIGVAAIAFPPDLRAQGCQSSIGCNASVQRSLTFEDGACLDSQVFRYHAYAVPITSGTSFTARVQSGFFAPGIDLISPAGSTIASANGTVSAQISINITSGGNFFVKVRNTAVGDGGPYTLTISCSATGGGPSQPDFIISVQPGTRTLPRNAATTYRVTSTPIEGFSEEVSLSVVNLPFDVAADPPMFAFPSPGTGARDITVRVGSAAPNGQHVINVVGRATSGKVSIGSGQLIVDAPCIPPSVLPSTILNLSARSGQRARLSVATAGTSPKQYQWYASFSPSTRNLIEGATSVDYETPPLVAPALFWVRVTNECGSADSPTITLTPIDSSRRRAVRH